MEIGKNHLQNRHLIKYSIVNNSLSIFRFGSGIIIYWFGYLDQVGRCPDNKDFIIVTDDFPKKDELVLINNPFGLSLSS